MFQTKIFFGDCLEHIRNQCVTKSILDAYSVNCASLQNTALHWFDFFPSGNQARKADGNVPVFVL